MLVGNSGFCRSLGFRLFFVGIGTKGIYSLGVVQGVYSPSTQVYVDFVGFQLPK